MKDIDISKIKNKIYTSVDLFLKYFNVMTIGITATKGKSTTSTLIYEILKAQGKDAYLLGNIGVPIFDKIEDIKKESIVVLEISSHQLEFMKYTTKIALLLNIYPAHLDHHNSYMEYINAKYNIFANEENMKQLYPDFNQIQIYGKETEWMKEKNFKYNKNAKLIDIDDKKYRTNKRKITFKNPWKP